MNDEDAPKKSLTDAITKAASQVGVASSIFLGRWDDNKYVAEVGQRFKEQSKVDEVKRLSALINGCEDAPSLESLWVNEKPAIAKLSDEDFEQIKSEFGAAKLAFSERSRVAAE